MGIKINGDYRFILNYKLDYALTKSLKKEFHFFSYAR